MKHHMKLNSSPFTKIKQGKKTIELRLNDDKRKLVHIGDIIEFSNIDNIHRTILCQVINIFHFNSFSSLYKELPLLKCGYTEENITKASPKDMEKYYPTKIQEKYGVLGIEIKLL